MLHKKSKVEFYPLGVIGAIVSWNYPFHNIFNPMLAAVFSGNGVVIKVPNSSLSRTFLLFFKVEVPDYLTKYVLYPSYLNYYAANISLIDGSI